MNKSNPFAEMSEAEDKRLRQLIELEMKFGAEYDPNEKSNFWEAVSNADDARLNRVKELLDANEYVAAHAALNLIAYDYWFDYVALIRREQAIDELASEQYDRTNSRRYAVMH